MTLDCKRVVVVIRGAAINCVNGLDNAGGGHIILAQGAQLGEFFLCVNVDEINLGALSFANLIRFLQIQDAIFVLKKRLERFLTQIFGDILRLVVSLMED